MSDCTLDLYSPRFEKPARDGVAFLLMRAGRRQAKGQLTADGAIVLRGGAVPDEATQAALKAAAEACAESGGGFAAIKEAFAKASKPKKKAAKKAAPKKAAKKKAED